MPATKRRSGKARLSIVGFGVLALALPAFAWGPQGHTIVREIAFINLSDQARTQVLQLRDRDYKTFSDSCLWADDIREERPETKPYHYINVRGDPEPDEILETVGLPKARTTLVQPGTGDRFDPGQDIDGGQN